MKPTTKLAPVRGACSCVDCPARQRGVLTDLLGNEAGRRCQLSSVVLEQRAVLPPSFFTGYAFGIVRRGVLVRERCQPNGSRTAIDVAGRGAYVPLGLGGRHTGYAATRVLLCVYPNLGTSALSRYEHLGVELLQLANETLERVESIAEAKGRASAAERIAALEAVLAEWLGPQSLAELLQRDVAALLGMRTETVCRVLRAHARA